MELIVERLTAQGVMETDALYEAPFADLHSGGPDGVFADRSRVVSGLFGALRSVHENLTVPQERAG